jgi:hypothetical protein
MRAPRHEQYVDVLLQADRALGHMSPTALEYNKRGSRLIVHAQESFAELAEHVAGKRMQYCWCTCQAAGW